MSEYKRMTKSGGKFASSVYSLDTANFVYGDDIIESQNEGLVQQLIERLAELEDKIEQETLIELPCRVGDTVYQITRDFVSEYKIKGFRCFESGHIFFEWQCIKGIYINIHGFYINVIGQTVFLTKAEAEKKLEELRSKK